MKVNNVKQKKLKIHVLINLIVAKLTATKKILYSKKLKLSIY